MYKGISDSMAQSISIALRIPFDVEKFLNWYYKSGTPKVYINQSWDSKNSILNVSFEQKIDGDKGNENKEMVISILHFA